MDLVRFTRQLIDIESVTGNEAAAGEFLGCEVRAAGFDVREIPVEGSRFNVLALPPGQNSADIVFSTHMDTVPPFIASSEDETSIYGRGACDAKGIIAAQVAAALRLRHHGARAGLLFTVGEERDSIGAGVANQHAIRCRFLVNGEPTDSRLAIATKGALHVEVIARGKMAHSAYPELGESAIEKLLDALTRIRSVDLPTVPEVGHATLNIGTIAGGRAPNVIPDQARAELLVRTVGPTDDLKRRFTTAVGELAEVRFGAESPFVRLRTVPGIPTMVASFSTDIPYLSNWGEPLLLGPGSIHVAHTDREFLSKREQAACADLYVRLAQQLLS